jgi:hypothetical protein
LIKVIEVKQFTPFDWKVKNVCIFLYAVVPEVILIKINGNAMYLAREPFGLAYNAVDAGYCDVDRPENLAASVCGCALVGGRV